MRVPLSWLRDYVDVQLTAEQLAERLTLLGMEVKGLERWGADWRNVVTGELLEVARHPRADRLSLTKVRVGDEVLEIVCGATNIAAGQRVPVALPGAVLPGNRAIERTEKMGVVSNGMLCSGDELRLTGDADGILILPPDTPLGVPLADLYGDVVLDVDVKPNRGDVLCLVGLAREVAALTGAPVRFPEIDLVEAHGPRHGRPAGGRGRRSTAVLALRRPLDRRVSSVRPSPDHVQMRLLAAGMRPISNVVDATNYVMLELGKPIHAFDGAAVARVAHRQGRPACPPRRAGRAAGDAGPRRARAAARDAAHRRCPRSARPCRGHGRGDVRGVRCHDGRHHRVGRLRSRQHPAHGLPLRPPLGGEPPVREGPGSSPRAHRRRPRHRARGGVGWRGCSRGPG